MKLYYIYKTQENDPITTKPSLVDGLVFDINFKGIRNKNRRFYLILPSFLSDSFTLQKSLNYRPGWIKFLGKHIIPDVPDHERISDMFKLFDIGYRDGRSFWKFTNNKFEEEDLDEVCYLISKIYKDDILRILF